MAAFAFCLIRRLVRPAWLAVGALMLFINHAPAQIYTPGSVYFGRSNYIEYAVGDLPFIMSAPHGGTLVPTEMPDRTNCTTCNWDFATATDSYTDDVAERVWAEVGILTGHRPHVIICNLSRKKIDCNREIVEGAQGDPETVIAWNEFRNFIITASNNVITNFARGFYIDQHGQSHPEQRLELGYLLDKYDLTNTDSRLDTVSTFKNISSIRSLANFVSNTISFSKLLRGTNSFGEFMVNEGYPATPSFTTPAPFTNPSSSTSFFEGGYNTGLHGSDGGGPLNALQIEANMTGVRDTAANRQAYAQALARTLEKYFAMHFGITLRSCAPSVWSVGSGNWSSSNSWALALTPVSTNFLVFAGPGGTATHNLAALTAGTGVVSSISFATNAGGPYTIAGNAFTLNGGLTNNNNFTNTISSAIGLNVASRFAVNAGALAVSGTISGAGSLTKSGLGTLALTASNSWTGATTNLAGTISINGTTTFGDGSNPLVFSGGDLLVLNTRSTAPISNDLIFTAPATISGNGTLTNSTRIVLFSSGNVSTSGGTLTIRNAGGNVTATNNVFRVRFSGGGLNFIAPISIGSGSDVPAAQSQLESYNDVTAADQVFSGVISGTGQFRRDAASASNAGRTALTAANTYSGGTLILAGTLFANNTNGSATGTGAVSISAPGTLAGTGSVAGAVACVGLISPGPGAASLTFGGGLDLSAGGTNLWHLSALSETTNFDQLILTGGNLVLGGASRLVLQFTNAALVPTNTSPFWLTSHSWKIVSLTGTATNPAATRFAALNNSVYATGSFTNYADTGGNIWLAYNANPAARPLIQTAAMLSSNAFRLTSSAETNRTYVLQTAASLGGSWQSVSTNITSSGVLSLTNLTGGDPSRFYRLLVLP